MTYEEIESYAIMHILESDSTEAFEKMQQWIEGALWMQQQANGVNTSHEQALHKHGVMPSLFAVSTEEGINELFWGKKKAEEKFAIYVKEFPSTLFWVEEVFPS